MRIAFITDSISAQSTGIGHYSLSLLDALSKSPHEIIRVDYNSKKYLRQYSQKEIIIKNRFPCFRTLLWHFFLLKRLSQDDFDVIINPSFFPNVLGSKSKLVFVVHDLTMFLFPEHSKFGKKEYFKLLLPMTLKNCNKILANSISTREDISRLLDIEQEKIVVVYPKVDPIFIEPQYKPFEIVRAKYGLPNSYYLFTGTVEPRKNLIRLLKAFDQVFEITSTPLVLVGKLGWKNKRFARVLRGLKHKSHVFIIGYADREDLPTIYHNSTSLTFPSLYEGFGFPPLEAMCCGSPVIASNTSSIPEVCGDGALYIDPTSVIEITEAMISIVEDKKLRKSMINTSAVQAKKFYNIDLSFLEENWFTE